jgi:hypothetical protein
MKGSMAESGLRLLAFSALLELRFLYIGVTDVLEERRGRNGGEKDEKNEAFGLTKQEDRDGQKEETRRKAKNPGV